MCLFQRSGVSTSVILLLVVSCTGAKVNATSISAASLVSNTVSYKPLSSSHLIVATTLDVSHTQTKSNLAGMTPSSITATIPRVLISSTPLTTSNISLSERIATSIESKTTVLSQSFLNQHSTPSKLTSTLNAQSIQPTRTKAFVSDTKSIQPTRTKAFVSDTKSIEPTKTISFVSDTKAIQPTRTKAFVSDTKLIEPTKTISFVSDTKSIQPTRTKAFVSDTKLIEPTKTISFVSDTKSIQPTRTKADTKSIKPTKTISFIQHIFPPSILSSISIIANSIPTKTSSTSLQTRNLPQATPTPAVTSSSLVLSIKATPTTIIGTSVTPAVTPTPYLLFANRDTIRRVDLDGTGLRTVVGNSSLLQNAIGIDYDIRHNYLLWTDVQSQQIFMADLKGDNVTVLVDSGLTIPDGLAWDWINAKAYWSDSEHREIEVLDPYTGHRRRLVYTGPSTVPRGITVDPVITRYIYWTDWGDVAKIERISMDGAPSTRQVLHNTDLIWPNDLTIDFTTQTLYWVDANLDKIESSNLDGNNRTLLTQSLILHPFSITVFSGMLYWSDWAVDLILHTSLFDLHRVRALTPRLETDPMGLKVVHHTRQPLGSTVNPCLLANGNCTHLCLLSSSHQADYTCSCPEGLSLSSNGRSCFSVTTTEVPLTLEGSCFAAGFTECCQGGSCLGSPPTCFCDAFCSETDSCCSDITSLCQQDYLVFANRRFIQRLELNTFNLTTLYTDTNKNIVGFDYDYRRGFLYWSDLSSNSIFRSTLSGEAVTVIVNGTLSIPDDVAVDWLSNLLYWTEAGTSTISVYNLERGHRLTLFSLPDSSVPRGIAVDPVEGYIFWTDWGTPAKVERASMDGTGRTTIANTSLRWPNGITIDYDSQLLYWVDAGLDKIESSRYDGSDRRVLLSSGVLHPFSITFFKGTLYWTDWMVDSVFSSSVQSNVSSVVYSELTVDPMGIQAISPTRQKFSTILCGPDSSNCDHLCLLNNNRTTTCACADGYMLASNGSDCIVLPTVVTTLPSGGSCVRAGFTGCCTNGTCEGLPRGCFCDRFCVGFEDCCDDVAEVCPELRPKVSTATVHIGSFSTSTPLVASPGISVTSVSSFKKLSTSSISTTTVSQFTTPSLTQATPIFSAQLTPTLKGTQATTDLTVRVGAAVGGVIIFVLLVIFVILMVLLVVMKRRTSIKYATFNNPPDQTTESVSSGLSFQNPVAISADSKENKP